MGELFLKNFLQTVGCYCTWPWASVIGVLGEQELFSGQEDENWLAVTGCVMFNSIFQSLSPAGPVPPTLLYFNVQHS